MKDILFRRSGPGDKNALYELCCGEMRKAGVDVQNGVFRTHMLVHLVNDGPVTILLDSRKNFWGFLARQFTSPWRLPLFSSSSTTS